MRSYNGDLCTAAPLHMAWLPSRSLGCWNSMGRLEDKEGWKDEKERKQDQVRKQINCSWMRVTQTVTTLGSSPRRKNVAFHQFLFFLLVIINIKVSQSRRPVSEQNLHKKANSPTRLSFWNVVLRYPIKIYMPRRDWMGIVLTLQWHSLFLESRQKTDLHFTLAHLVIKREPLGQALGRERDSGKVFCGFKCDLDLSAWTGRELSPENERSLCFETCTGLSMQLVRTEPPPSPGAPQLFAQLGGGELKNINKVLCY